MYPEQFDEFRDEFLNDPEVANLLSKIKERFEDGYKKHILDHLDEDEIEDVVNTIYNLMDDLDPNDYTIFDILLFD